jgi:hypothetical protein
MKLEPPGREAHPDAPTTARVQPGNATNFGTFHHQGTKTQRRIF